MSAMICTQCGAGLTGDATECSYCGTAYDHGRAGRPGSGSKPDCPRCHQALATKTYSGTTVAHCKRCKGLWVGHDAMHRLLKLRKKDARKLHALNRSAKQRGVYARNARPGSLQRDVAPARCPACHHAMRLESIKRDGTIYLDICDDHGTWFDQSELRSIVDKHARNALRRSAGGRRDVLPRAAKHSDWDAGSAISLFGAVVEVIDHVLDDGFDFFD